MKLLLTTVIAYLCWGINDTKASNISIRLNQMKSDSLLVHIVPLTNPDAALTDTIVLKNGQGNYDLEIKEFSDVTIIPFELIHHFKNGAVYPLAGSRMRLLINPKESLNIEGAIAGTKVIYTAKGNALSEQFARSREGKLALFNERYFFENAYNQKHRLQHKQHEIKKHAADRAANDLLCQDENLAYVREHLNEEVAPLLLLEVADSDSVLSVYQKLGPVAKSSYFGKILETKVKDWLAAKP